jgi:hypothetical protein
MSTESVKCKEIAAQLRKEFKAKYPNTKFSVTSTHNAVRVFYVDGPIASEIEAEVEKYSGRREYDHNYCDYGKNIPVEFKGEQRLTDLIYVSVNRDYSPEFLQSVVDHVKGTYAGKENDGVKIAIHRDGTAYFDSSNYEAVHDYREVVRRCDSYSPVSEQEAARWAKKEEEFQLYLMQKEIDNMLSEVAVEEEKEIIAKIVPTSIEDVEQQGLFCTALFSKMNKLNSVAKYVEECNSGNFEIRDCLIQRIVTFSAEAYDAYSEFLMESFDWLTEMGGTETRAKLREVSDWSEYTEQEKDEWRSQSYDKCVLVVCNEGDEGNKKIPLLVDPQGYTYARYVGIAGHENVAKVLEQVKPQETEPQPEELIQCHLDLQLAVQEEEPQLTVEVEVEPEEEPQNNKVVDILSIRRDRLEEKKGRKFVAYERLREKHEKLSLSSYERSRDLTSVIPFGQPILIGHHSEKGHRSLLRRSDNAMRQSIEHDRTAKHYQEKLIAMESNTAVYSDDPDAIAKLKRKLASLERTQERNRAINKIVKARKGSQEEKVQQLMQLLNCSESLAKGYFKPDFCGRIGIPDYELTNNGAEIRRCKKRIEELEAKLEYAAEVECEEQEFEGFKVAKNYVIDRIQIIFDSIPQPKIRQTLKANGFRWSPDQGAWQRHLNPAGIAAANYVVKQLTEDF